MPFMAVGYAMKVGTEVTPYLEYIVLGTLVGVNLLMN